ncbi:MAG: DUF2897 family protein [Shewanella sp.]
MSNLETWLIIILVIGVIASNLTVLKYSAKFKMTQFGKDTKPGVKPKKAADKNKLSVSSEHKLSDATCKANNTDRGKITDTDNKPDSSV